MAEQQRRNRRRTEDTSHMIQSQNAGVYAIDIEELFYELLAKWKIIVCIALGMAIAFGAFTHFFITPTYQATAVIYVLNREDSAISISDLNIGTALAADYIKVFEMWEVHEEVISNLNLPYTYTEMEDMLTVVNDADTRMLEISITSTNPTEAAAIANEYATVVSKYVEETMATQRPSLMSVARVPVNPVSPNVKRNVLLGALLGGFIVVGVVFVKILKDDKYKTAEDIRRYTGLVNLAVVPDETESTSSKRGGAQK